MPPKSFGNISTIDQNKSNLQRPISKITFEISKSAHEVSGLRREDQRSSGMNVTELSLDSARAHDVPAARQPRHFRHTKLARQTTSSRSQMKESQFKKNQDLSSLTDDSSNNMSNR